MRIRHPEALTYPSYWLFLAIQVADVVLTYVGIYHYHQQEGSPIPRWFITHMGFRPSVVLLKGTFTVWAGHYWPRWSRPLRFLLNWTASWGPVSWLTYFYLIFMR